MKSMPAGTSADLFIPQPSTELGYGLLLTVMETYKISFEMKSALKQAKKISVEPDSLPRSEDGSIGLSKWFFQAEYPGLTLYHYQYTDEATNDSGWSFAIVSSDILVGQSIEDILFQHNYELPLPNASSIEEIKKLKKRFGLVDEIGWKHWL